MRNFDIECHVDTQTEDKLQGQLIETEIKQNKLGWGDLCKPDA